MMCGRMVTIANAVCLDISVSQSELDRGESVANVCCHVSVIWQQMSSVRDPKCGIRLVVYRWLKEKQGKSIASISSARWQQQGSRSPTRNWRLCS